MPVEAADLLNLAAAEDETCDDDRTCRDVQEVAVSFVLEMQNDQDPAISRKTPGMLPARNASLPSTGWPALSS